MGYQKKLISLLGSLKKKGLKPRGSAPLSDQEMLAKKLSSLEYESSLEQININEFSHNLHPHIAKRIESDITIKISIHNLFISRKDILNPLAPRASHQIARVPVAKDGSTGELFIDDTNHIAETFDMLKDVPFFKQLRHDNRIPDAASSAFPPLPITPETRPDTPPENGLKPFIQGIFDILKPSNLGNQDVCVEYACHNPNNISDNLLKFVSLLDFLNSKEQIYFFLCLATYIHNQNQFKQNITHLSFSNGLVTTTFTVDNQQESSIIEVAKLLSWRQDLVNLLSEESLKAFQSSLNKSQKLDFLSKLEGRPLLTFFIMGFLCNGDPHLQRHVQLSKGTEALNIKVSSNFKKLQTLITYKQTDFFGADDTYDFFIRLSLLFNKIHESHLVRGSYRRQIDHSPHRIDVLRHEMEDLDSSLFSLAKELESLVLENVLHGEYTSKEKLPALLDTIHSVITTFSELSTRQNLTEGQIARIPFFKNDAPKNNPTTDRCTKANNVSHNLKELLRAIRGWEASHFKGLPPKIPTDINI
jgi:hypothetical protein